MRHIPLERNPVTFNSLFSSIVVMYFISFFNTMSVSEGGKGSRCQSFISKFRAFQYSLEATEKLYPYPEHFTGTRTLPRIFAVPQDYKQHVRARDSSHVMFLWEHEIHHQVTLEMKRTAQNRNGVVPTKGNTRLKRVEENRLKC